MTEEQRILHNSKRRVASVRGNSRDRENKRKRVSYSARALMNTLRKSMAKSNKDNTKCTKKTEEQRILYNTKRHVANMSENSRDRENKRQRVSFCARALKNALRENMTRSTKDADNVKCRITNIPQNAQGGATNCDTTTAITQHSTDGIDLDAIEQEYQARSGHTYTRYLSKWHVVANSVLSSCARSQKSARAKRTKRSEKTCPILHSDRDHVESDDLPAQWEFPDTPQAAVVERCRAAFLEALERESCEMTCGICGQLTPYYTRIALSDLPNLQILKPTCKYPLSSSLDSFISKGLMEWTPCMLLFRKYALEPRGLIEVNNGECTENFTTCKRHALIVCNPKASGCHGFLVNGFRPPQSLYWNWIGEQPIIFADLSFTEIICISRVRIMANITTVRAHGGQRSMKGNSAFFHQDIKKLYDILPLASIDLCGLCKIVFVGAETNLVNDINDGLRMFRIRRDRVKRCLEWLKENNPYYNDIVISPDRLNSLPVDGIPQALLYFVDGTPREYADRSVMSDYAIDSALTTSGVLEEIKDEENASQRRNSASSRLQNFIQFSRKDKPLKDFERSVELYAFPHLFPYGYGGDFTSPRIYWRQRAKRYLNYGDRRFSKDRCYNLVTLNIRNRAETQGHCRFKFRSPRFEASNNVIASISRSVMGKAVQAIIDQNVNGVDPHVRELIKRLQIATTPVLGSSASRQMMRNRIRALTMQFGTPVFFITVNPADVHSPIMMRMAGVKIDLGNIEAALPDRTTRERYIVNDPVAAAKFSHCIFSNFFKFLIGYEQKEGGMLGVPKMYAGTVEEQGRKSLHMHSLIWISGASLEKIRDLVNDSSYKQRLIKYFDTVVKTAVDEIGYIPPDCARYKSSACKKCFEEGIYSSGAVDNALVEDIPHSARENIVGNEYTTQVRHTILPKIHSCVDYSKFHDIESESSRQRNACNMWPYSKSLDDYDLKKQYDILCLVVLSQIHIHNHGCFKNGDTCRYRFGRRPVDETVFDCNGNIQFKRSHPYLNNFCPEMMEVLRCNMDIKAILSGGDSKALLHYITNYITKRSLSTETIYDLCYRGVSAVEEMIERNGEVVSSTELARRLVQSCYFKIRGKEEFGAPYSCFLQMGYPPFYCPAKFKPLYWSIFDAMFAAQDRNENLEEMSRNDDDRDSNDGSHSDAENSVVSDEDIFIDLEDGIPDGENIVYTNVGIDYKYRPILLEKLAPIDFATLYKKVIMKDTVEQSQLRFEEGHPQQGSHCLRKETVNYVPEIRGKGLPIFKSTPERFYRAMCILLTPWRNVVDIKPEISYEELWNSLIDTNKTTKHNVDIFYNIILSQENNTEIDGEIGDCNGGDQSQNGNDFMDDDDDNIDYDISEDQLENLMEVEALACTNMVTDPAIDPCCVPPSLDSEVTISTQTLKKYWKEWKNTSSKPEEIDVSIGLSEDVCIIEEKDYHEYMMMTGGQLRGRQRVAFYLFIDAFEKKLQDNTIQNLVLVTGAGGVGKSRLIKSVVEYMGVRNLSGALSLTAPSGSAACCINGSTIDSVAYLMQKNHGEKHFSTLRRIRMLILDECYFLGARKLYQLSHILCRANSNDQAFGGISVLFLGDPRQLPAVLQVPLYSAPTHLARANLRRCRTKSDRQLIVDKEVELGLKLWSQINHVIVLKKQHRQATDIAFSTILDKLRHGELDDESIQQLNRRRVNEISPDEIESFKYATYITLDNDTRSNINVNFVRRVASQENPMVVVKSIDTFGRKSPRPGHQIHLWQLPDLPKRPPGYFCLVKGLPVILRLNLSSSLKLANGTLGRVHSFFDNCVCIYFEHLKDRTVFPGLPNGVVPMQKEIVYSSSPFGRVYGSRVPLSRKQYPFGYAKAMTCHSVQGHTLDNIVVLKADAMTLPLLYVTLSRVRSLKNIIFAEATNFNLVKTKTWCQDIAQHEQELDQKQVISLAYTTKLFPFLVDETYIQEATTDSYTRKHS